MLLDAAEQLDIVRSIRQAIQKADQQAHDAASSQNVPAPATSQPVSPPPISERLSPSTSPPAIETERTVHREVELKYISQKHGPCHCPRPERNHPERDHHGVYFTIQPPWSVLPWQNPPPIQRTVKIVVVRPDILSKGTMIDSFI